MFKIYRIILTCLKDEPTLIEEKHRFEIESNFPYIMFRILKNMLLIVIGTERGCSAFLVIIMLMTCPSLAIQVRTVLGPCNTGTYSTRSLLYTGTYSRVSLLCTYGQYSFLAIQLRTVHLPCNIGSTVSLQYRYVQYTSLAI